MSLLWEMHCLYPIVFWLKQITYKVKKAIRMAFYIQFQISF